MPPFTRRDFLATLAALGVASQAAARASAADGAGTFAHGVASGDPLADRVILWTRVTPATPGAVVDGRWLVATDPRLRRVVARGRFSADPTRDHTVKVDVVGLAPGRPYFYRFECDGARSPIGRTRTLPQDRVEALRIAWASCASYPHGFYNAYRRLAERADLDLVLHVGDYIYEHALGEYVNANPAIAAARAVVPPHETVSLADYRLRYALYRSDPDLQEVHRQHPFVCVWDDHESANDAWRDGASNHQPENGEGEWAVRKAASIRAYREWLPIRDDGPTERSYRRFQLGGLADLMMLDTRLVGRDRQAAGKGGGELAADDPRITAPDRTLLGAEQERWLAAELAGSAHRGARWQLLGQQVMLAPLSTTAGRTIRNADQWDGYPAARARLFAALREHGIDSAVVLTGDMHSSWCNEVVPNPWAAPGDDATRPLAVEFVCPAISSSGPVRDPREAAENAVQLRAISPHMKYVDLNRRGYGLLDVTAERMQAEIWHVPTVDERAPGESLAAAFVVEPGRPALQAAAAPAPARSAPDPAPADG